MATAQSQRRWRAKNRPVKSQLNVMTRALVHDYLEEIAARFGLRGKGEAVTFASFVLKALLQRGEYSAETKHLLDVLAQVYRKDRGLYSG